MKWILFLPLTVFSAITGYTDEHQVIVAAVERNIPDPSLRPLFVKLLKSIRRAENGKPGREFGVIHKKAKTLDQQAGWCAAICWRRYCEWETELHGDDFLEYLASKYAPEKVANDPNGLNANWLRNVRRFMKEQK